MMATAPERRVTEQGAKGMTTIAKLMRAELGVKFHWSFDGVQTLCNRGFKNPLIEAPRPEACASFICKSCVSAMNRLVRTAEVLAHEENATWFRVDFDAPDVAEAFAPLQQTPRADNSEVRAALTPKFVAAGDRRPRCGAERSGTHPCIRVADDCKGEHYDSLGRTWTDQDNIRPAKRCAEVPPAGRALCVLVHNAEVRAGDEIPHLDRHGRGWVTSPKLCQHGITAGWHCSVCADIEREAVVMDRTRSIFRWLLDIPADAVTDWEHVLNWEQYRRPLFTPDQWAAIAEKAEDFESTKRAAWELNNR